MLVRSLHRWKQSVRYFTRQIRLILASHSFVLTLLKALRRRYGSLMGLVALKRAFTVRSVNPVWLSQTLILSLPFLAVSLFLSPSAEATWKFPYLCGIIIIITILLSSASSRPSLHSSIHRSTLCETEQEWFFLYSFNSPPMNQSLVAARDTFSCFILGALR